MPSAGSLVAGTPTLAELARANWPRVTARVPRVRRRLFARGHGEVHGLLPPPAVAE
jgi:hypothetical protein